MSEVVKILMGHDSPETALIISDYPTGRMERCVKRVWVDQNPKHGQRCVYQTSQPKSWMMMNGWKEGDAIPEHWWRARKASTYSGLIVMYLDENGYQQFAALHWYETREKIEAFEARFKEYFEANEYARKFAEEAKKFADKRKAYWSKATFTTVTHDA
jgi:hypothetical protein